MGSRLTQDRVYFSEKSEIYYTDPSSGKVTHVWQADSDLPGGGEWIKL